MKVEIDGIEYVPKREIVTEEARAIMAEVYGALWADGVYDPVSESVGKFARPLSDKMRRLNAIIGFVK